MFQIWTTSKLGALDLALQKKIYFYAPLIENLDFMGIDPVIYQRNTGSGNLGRDGLFHPIGLNVPAFNFVGDTPAGLFMEAASLLQFSADNSLNDTNTLIWFQDSSPKSTPTDTNVFASNGFYVGPSLVHVKHIAKASSILSAVEINTIQVALGDVAQVIPPPPTSGDLPPSTFVAETPSGIRNGSNTTFGLSQNPNPNSMILTCFGIIVELVSPGPPQEMEFTLSGVGNRTITLGLGPTTSYPFRAHYVTA